MSLSNKEKEQLNRRLDKIKDIGTFLREREKEKQEEKEGNNLNIEAFEVDVENMSLVLTYLSTENLVKHSKRLTCWTIVIAITTLALIFSTITQIILEFK